MSRPRLLFLTCHLPFPPLSGGRLRELELVRRLGDVFDVHLLAASKPLEEDRGTARELEPYCSAVEVFGVEPPAARPDRSEVPLQVLRHRAPALTRRVHEVLAAGGADLVHVEGFYLAQHVPEEPGVPLLLVEQNVEYELWGQRCLAAGRPSDLDPFRQHNVTRAAEIAAWRRADIVATLTSEDGAAVRRVLPPSRVRIVPDGCDHLPRPDGRARPVDRPEAPLLVLVGNFAYEPNVDAAHHLVGDILPQVRERAPETHLWLVGNEPPREVRDLAEDRIRVTGRVPDVVPYMDAADVAVCPLRIGGGMKVKVIEALQRQKALVSTGVGVQGFPGRARRLLAVRDDPAEFAAKAAELLNDPARRRAAERRAGHAAGLLTTWDEAATMLGDAYCELLSRRAGVRRAYEELVV